MKHFTTYRAQIKLAEQTAALILADIRGCHKLTCAPGAVAKLAERRTYAILLQAQQLRDALSQLSEDIQEK